MIDWRSEGSDEDGEPCTVRNWDWVSEEDAGSTLAQRAYELHRWLEAQATNGYWTVPDCPVQPGQPQPPVTVIRDVVRGQLPLPSPALQPSERTLPGLRTYLEIGAPTSWSPDLDGTTIPVTEIRNVRTA